MSTKNTERERLAIKLEEIVYSCCNGDGKADINQCGIRLTDHVLTLITKARIEELDTIFEGSGKSRPVKVDGKIDSVVIGSVRKFIARKTELESQLKAEGGFSD